MPCTTLPAETGLLNNVRGIGAMVAADLVVGDEVQRAGLQVCQAAVQRGAWLRPLGNTIYWLPPLIMSTNEVTLLAQITRNALISTLISGSV